MCCPQCGSFEVAVQQFDAGTCYETGYQDAGDAFACRACGATGDAAELVALDPVTAEVAMVAIERKPPVMEVEERVSMRKPLASEVARFGGGYGIARIGNGMYVRTGTKRRKF